MSQKYFGSQNNALAEQLIDFQRNELSILSQTYMDVLTPSVTSMKATQVVIEMLLELGDHIKKNGKSERLEKSVKRLFNLLDLIAKLNNLTGDLNTLKLSNNSIMAENHLLRVDNINLKKEIEAMIKSHNEL